MDIEAQVSPQDLASLPEDQVDHLILVSSMCWGDLLTEKDYPPDPLEYG